MEISVKIEYFQTKGSVTHNLHMDQDYDVKDF